MDNAQRELREWLCHGRETGGEQKLCLEIAGEAQAEADREHPEGAVWFPGMPQEDLEPAG